ncbi:MAG: hypothetical protein IKU25_08640 [Clostridia bacterium]|nr:hypothetical protein [Clostridia bacterium]
MKKIVCLLLVAVMFVTFCACGNNDTDTTTTTVSSYEQALIGTWNRANSDIVLELKADNKGTQTQKSIATNLYWEADADGIVLKTNMVGENVKTPYTLDGDTLTIQNVDGTKVVYTRVK